MNKMATLHELGTIYSLSDALDLNEILNLEEEADFLSRDNNNANN